MDEIAEFIRKLKELKEKKPDIYRHIIGLIKALLN